MRTYPKAELRIFRAGQKFIWNDIIYTVTETAVGNMVECSDGKRLWAWPSVVKVSPIT